MAYLGHVVGAIVQARTGSSRFPRKVFADLAGRPLLRHIIDRLRCCGTLDKIVIATTQEPPDAELSEFARSEGVLAFAGSTHDVQKRFIDAAHLFGVEVIVRICGDSPFVDPEMIDRLVREMIDGGGDYAEPDPALPAAYEGMEALTLGALTRSRPLGNDGPDREHVTLFMRRHPEHFKIIHLRPAEAARGRFRLSVDNLADLEFARAVFAALDKKGPPFTAGDLALFLKDHPEVRALNAHVRQKKTDAPDFHVAFYVTRRGRLPEMIRAARKLNEEWHCGVGFFGRFTHEDEGKFHAMGFRAAAFTRDDDDLIFKKVLRKWNVRVVLILPGDEIYAAHLCEMGYKVRHTSDPPEKILAS